MQFFGLEHLAARIELSQSIFPAYSKWSDPEMLNFKFDNVSVTLDSNQLEKKVPEKDIDLMATQIIKDVCEDIERQYMFDVEATPEVIPYFGF